MYKAKEKISYIRDIKEFKVEEGQYFIISDPSYQEIEDVIPNTDIKINHKVKAKAGNWVYKFDPVTRALSVYEEGSFNSEESDLKINEFDKVISLCVDSGQVGVFLESSYRNNSLLEDIEFEDDDYDDYYGNWYRACCEITASKHHVGFVPYGFVKSSRCGDGIFTAKLIYSKDTNEVVYIKIETHHMFGNDEE